MRSRPDLNLSAPAFRYAEMAHRFRSWAELHYQELCRIDFRFRDEAFVSRSAESRAGEAFLDHPFLMARIWQVLRHRTEIILRHESGSEHQILHPSLKAGIVLPIVFSGDEVGALTLLSKDPRAYEDERKLRGLREWASLLGLSVSSIRQNEQAQQTCFRMRETFQVLKHELCNRLTALRLGVQLVQMKALNGDEVSLSRMVKECDRIQGLVESIGDASEARPRELQLNLRRVCLKELLLGVIDSYRPVAETRGVEISFIAEGDLSGTWDPDRLEELFGNLLCNALKYGLGKPILFRAFHEKAFVHVLISDRGLGIPKDEQPRVFEKFGRSSATGHIHGTGLGLFIAKKIVLSHGGSIEVVPKESEGSDFLVRLPKNSS